MNLSRFVVSNKEGALRVIGGAIFCAIRSPHGPTPFRCIFLASIVLRSIPFIHFVVKRFVEIFFG